MNIAIVGAGSTGVATAYALAEDGHQVTLYERRSTVAEEASFGHAGWLAPALLHPWNLLDLGTGERTPESPGRQALARLGQAPLTAQLRWLWQRRQAGRRLRKAEGPSPAMVALETLAIHSQRLQQAMWNSWEQDPETVQGSLVLLGSEAERERLQPALDALTEAGTTWQPLDAGQTRLREPSLAQELDFAGALYFPAGGAANARLATLMQRQAAQTAGVHFATQSPVIRLQAAATGRPAQLWLQGQSQPQSHDTIIVCAGADASGLLAPLGLRPATVALHGYGINAPLRDETYAPRHAIVDWSEQLTLVRLGQRLRVVAGAELGSKGAMHEATLQRMYHRIHELFPGSAALNAGVQLWHGTRMCTADGLPLLGPSGQPGIWLNLGHGGCGAAIAQGCARMLADLIAQRPTPVDSALLHPRRFG